MHFHLINNLTFGGSESIASVLAKSFSSSRLYTLYPFSRVSKVRFEARFSVQIFSFLFYLNSFIRQKNSSFFTHNVQSHIVVNLINYFFSLFGLKPRTHYNVIHFDAAHLKYFWRLLLIFSSYLSRPNLIFVSDFSKAQYHLFINLDLFSISIIPNAIPSRFFAIPTTHLLPPLNKSDINIGFIGRNASIKRLDLAIKTFSYLKQNSSFSFQFTLQSDISIIQLRNLISLSGLNSTLLNDISLISQSEDCYYFYDQVDAVISTSSTESFSLVAIECLAMQKRFYSFNSTSIMTILNDFDYNFHDADISSFAAFISSNLSKSYKLPDLSLYRFDRFLSSYSIL